MPVPFLNVTRLLAGSLLATAVAVTVSDRQADAAPSTTWVVEFKIDDLVGGGPGASSDGVNEGWYRDYRLETGSCVEAEPESTGHLHAVLNRRIDGTSVRCNPAGSDRQYRLRLETAPGACDRLWNAYGSAGVTMDADLQGCELFYTDNPRVRVADLFKKGSPSSTPVAFLSGMFPENSPNGRSYEIRLLDSAQMTAPDANTRRVFYDGQAYLFEFGNGKAKAVEAPFDLPFSMTFVRSVAP